MGIISYLLIINYIIALYVMYELNREQFWNKLKETQSEEAKEFMSDEKNENAVKHTVHIILLIPGYALIQTIFTILKKIF